MSCPQTSLTNSVAYNVDRLNGPETVVKVGTTTGVFWEKSSNLESSDVLTPADLSHLAESRRWFWHGSGTSTMHNICCPLQILQTYRSHILYSLVNFNTVILEVRTSCQETPRYNACNEVHINLATSQSSVPWFVCQITTNVRVLGYHRTLISGRNMQVYCHKDSFGVFLLM